MQPPNLEPETPASGARYLPMLREALALAEESCLLAAAALHCIQTDMKALYLPMHYWPRSVLRTYTRAFRHNAQAQLEFRRALALVVAHEPPATNPKRSSKTAQTTPSAAPEPPEPDDYMQTIVVEVTNGKTVTKYPDFTTEFFLAMPVGDYPSTFTRQICFTDRKVPREYAWTLTHNGQTYPAPDAVYVQYSVEEFYRIGRQELATHPPHVLPGEPSRKQYRTIGSRK